MLPRKKRIRKKHWRRRMRKVIRTNLRLRGIHNRCTIAATDEATDTFIRNMVRSAVIYRRNKRAAGKRP